MSQQNKRKDVSPLEGYPTLQRRRFLSDSPVAKFNIDMSESNGSPTASSHPPPSTLIEGDAQEGFSINIADFTKVILDKISEPLFLKAFAPCVANSLLPMVKLAMEEANQALRNQITAQEKVIALQGARITDLEHSYNELYDWLADADAQHEELEQYGRRNSLRFHNVLIPEVMEPESEGEGEMGEEGEEEAAESRDAITDPDTITDKVIVKLCKEKLKVDITEDDILRSHPIGRPNRHGKSQLICRFRSWKIKNKIYSNKKLLKGDNDKIFVTEDLTKYRQSLVSEIASAKRAGQVHTFWTNDGRIFLKKDRYGEKHLIRSFEDLDIIVPPADEAGMYY